MSDADSTQRPFAALPRGESEEPREPRIRGLELPEAIGIFFLLLIAAACGGLIAVYWPWNSGSQDISAANDRIAALEARVDQPTANRSGEISAVQTAALARLKTRLAADEARLAALEQTGGTTNVPLTQLSARVTALEATAPPADLKQELGSFALKSDEALLEARIAKLEARDPEPALKRAAAMMALADLVRVSASGAPFANELSTLRAVAPGLPAPELTALSRSGVPTRPMLAARITREAPGIIAAAREARAKSWLQRLWLHVTGLVSVRRVGIVEGKTTADILARAEVDAGKNDLDGALAGMAQLNPHARAAAMGWIDAAQSRVALDKDLRDLSNRVVAMLAAPLPGDAKPPAATVPDR
ncbi:MAG: COG4223 family protein [Rhizomicrobium sp.]